MKYKNLLALLVYSFVLIQLSLGQSVKPGTVTFKAVYGSASSQNVNTGAVEEITLESLLTEGFVIVTEDDSFLDIEFSNGVVGRLSTQCEIDHRSIRCLRR
jgi:hypothetical protein